jgi:phosphoribosyl 1,2-cyclic phosphate phosphodiesterase
MIEIKVLGCGSSLGVPVIGCNCNVCVSDSPYNKRLRSSLLISYLDKNILIDFGQDVRQQLLRENIKKIDSAILTHIHSDHVSGIDDLRPFHMVNKLPPVDIYSDNFTFELFKNRFPYLDKSEYFNKIIIDSYEERLINDVKFQFFKQDHGTMDSMGFRICNFAYANDLINFYQESEKYLYNLEILIIDCISYESTNTHSGLSKILKWNEQFSPKRIYLTNMSHRIDYFDIQKILPNNIMPLFDGQIIRIEQAEL